MSLRKDQQFEIFIPSVSALMDMEKLERFDTSIMEHGG